MALFTIDHFSESLGLSMSCQVIVPQSTQKQIGMAGTADTGDRFPALWLLHGRSDDHTIGRFGMPGSNGPCSGWDFQSNHRRWK